MLSSFSLFVIMAGLSSWRLCEWKTFFCFRFNNLLCSLQGPPGASGEPGPPGPPGRRVGLLNTVCTHTVLYRCIYSICNSMFDYVITFLPPHIPGSHRSDRKRREARNKRSKGKSDAPLGVNERCPATKPLCTCFSLMLCSLSLFLCFAGGNRNPGFSGEDRPSRTPRSSRQDWSRRTTRHPRPCG